MKIRKQDIPAAIFRIDKAKPILPYIPEMEGWSCNMHNLLSLILHNADFENGTVYDTQQFAEEITMQSPEDAARVRYNAEFYIAKALEEAARKNVLGYEYLGDDQDDYGHYVRFFKSPIIKEGDNG